MKDYELETRLREVADQFITLANQKCDTDPKDLVGLGFLYGAARFSSFVVASDSGGLTRYEENQERALDFFTEQFRNMLKENLDQYKEQFQEEARYSHLMKGKENDWH